MKGKGHMSDITNDRPVRIKNRIRRNSEESLKQAVVRYLDEKDPLTPHIATWLERKRRA